MGFITGLLTLPLAPIRGTVWLAERLYEQAQAELSDPAVLRRRLAEVDAARQDGSLDEDEAAEQEALLVRRLWEARGPRGPNEGWKV
jgi:cytochrome c-type biogenesis protein CcmH/NrfG